MGNRNTVVGFDVRKDTIEVSIAEGDRQGEVRHYGVIASDLEPLDKVVRALRAPNRTLHFVYEVGPCGFWDLRACRGPIFRITQFCRDQVVRRGRAERQMIECTP
jgi:hypothetical protein